MQKLQAMHPVCLLKEVAILLFQFRCLEISAFATSSDACV